MFPNKIIMKPRRIKVIITIVFIIGLRWNEIIKSNSMIVTTISSNTFNNTFKLSSNDSATTNTELDPHTSITTISSNTFNNTLMLSSNDSTTISNDSKTTNTKSDINASTDRGTSNTTISSNSFNNTLTLSSNDSITKNTESDNTSNNTLMLSSNDSTTTNTKSDINNSTDQGTSNTSSSISIPTSNSLSTLSLSVSLLANLSLHNSHPIVSIEELINMTNTEKECPPGLVYLEDYWAPSSAKQDDDNDDDTPLISRYIHVTSKTRCMTERLYNNLQLWRNFSIKFNYSFIFHNDDAMEYLLNAYSKLYNPMLQQVLHCAIEPTIKTDIWRAIVLYVYGGIYTDIDNAPGKDWLINVTNPKVLNNNESEIQPIEQTVCINKMDEAYFVVDLHGLASQYFMASKPNHVLMRILVDRCMERLLNQTDIYHLYIPIITGPNALQYAFVHFMNQSYALWETRQNITVSRHIGGIVYKKVQKGLYHSPNFNYSVRIAGYKEASNDIVFRDSLGKKNDDWKAMNMTYYFSYLDQVKNKEKLTCRELIIQTNNSTIIVDNNNDESMIDLQIEEEIKIGIPDDLTRYYLFFDEEIYHLKHKANLEYKTSWLSAVRMTRQEQLQYRVIA